MRELVFISVDCLTDLFQLRDLLADLFLVWFEGLVFLSDEEGTESWFLLMILMVATYVPSDWSHTNSTSFEMRKVMNLYLSSG